MQDAFILLTDDLGKFQAAVLFYDMVNVRLRIRNIYIILQCRLDTSVAFYPVRNHGF